MNQEDKAFTVAAVAFAVAAVAFVVAFVVAFAVAAVAAVAVAVAAVADESNYRKSYLLSGVSFALSLISFCLSSGAELHLNYLLSWSSLILALILTEIYFFSPISRNKKKLDISEVLGRKLAGLFYSSLTIFGVFTAYQITKNHFESILKWIGYIGAGVVGLAIIIGIIYGYLKLNQYLYNKK